jgi:poly(A) polymerase
MEQEPERIRPELSGADIMRILGVEPGPQVGRAYQHLLTLRLERGKVGRGGATAELLAWAEREGIIPPGPESG